MMTSAKVVVTSVTNNSSFQNYPHPDDHTIRTTDIPGFNPFTIRKVKMRRIWQFTETWVVTQRDSEGHIKIALNKENNMIASYSFATMAHVTPMVEWSNSTGWDFESTIKFNASTGEEYCEWFVCGVCGTEVAFNIKQKQAKAGWLYDFLSFLPETSKLQSAVYSEWK